MGIQQIQQELDDDAHLLLRLEGDWLVRDGLCPIDPGELVSGEARSVAIDSSGLAAWDSVLVAWLLGLAKHCRDQNIPLDLANAPDAASQMVELALTIPQRDDMARTVVQPDFLESVGQSVQSRWQGLNQGVEFLGETILGIGRLISGKCHFRRQDLWDLISANGPSSFALIVLINGLIGVILAFVGAIQLEKFGASIYVSSLVGLAMSREMAPMMTAILMAGRTGAAYAAQLGSMQVNEEVDALTTLGISPHDYLVIPRVVALCLMMPLLTIFANFAGILGGALVSVMMLDLSMSQYMDKMAETVALYHFSIGMGKSVIFAVIVAMIGCYAGIHSGRSATAVGNSTTAAVVAGIVAIVVADCLMAVASTVLGV